MHILTMTGKQKEFIFKVLNQMDGTIKYLGSDKCSNYNLYSTRYKRQISTGRDRQIRTYDETH